MQTSPQDKLAELEKQKQATLAEIAASQDVLSKEEREFLDKVEDRVAGKPFHATNVRETALIVRAVLDQLKDSHDTKQTHGPAHAKPA